LFQIIKRVNSLDPTFYFLLFASAKSRAKSSPRTPTVRWPFRTGRRYAAGQQTVRAVRGRPSHGIDFNVTVREIKQLTIRSGGGAWRSNTG